METGEAIVGILWLIVAIIAIVPIVIFAKTYRRVQSRKILVTTFAFSLFMVKAVTLSMRLVVGENDAIWYLNDEFWWSVAAVIDIVIIALFVHALSSKE